MCRPSDPYCRKPTAPFGSLSNSLPYSPLPVPVIDRLLGRTFSAPPAHLSRVLFLPKHNSKVTHLPVYEFTDAYRQAVKDAPLGSSLYKINMMFMSRPRGDGTDADVRFFVDVTTDKSRVAIEERSMATKQGSTATITLPTEQQEDSVLTVPGLGVFHVRASANLQSGTDESGRPSAPGFRQYPALTMESSDEPGTQWNVRSEDSSSLCYFLTESSVNERGERTQLRTHAIYHYAGSNTHHPVDHSEGVLLVPDSEDSQNQVISVALVFLLLWHMRELDTQQQKSSLSKLLRKLSIGKSNQ
ncbi:hypothetical protein AK830_g3597 [Neonectria ditissima]|uniref:Uncharacterized protein n=1 Tax=Neonectria ditissima TaxID=78410 RepID=A0A0P7B8D7_9HYPO|nr:hypothetical protein AK830_g3597 [Neonectria ditissima]